MTWTGCKATPPPQAQINRSAHTHQLMRPGNTLHTTGVHDRKKGTGFVLVNRNFLALVNLEKEVKVEKVMHRPKWQPVKHSMVLRGEV